MAKRINVVLRDETAQTVIRAAKPGERSRFIDRAIQHYAATRSPEALREQLKAAAIRDRDLAEEIARDWFAVDQESWQTASKEKPPENARFRGAEKSTS